jgi:antitoxin HigA-1
MADTRAKGRLLPNPHPGEILAEQFLKPMKLSQTALARAIGVSLRRVNKIVLGKRAITADTDLRFARYFNMSEGFLLGYRLITNGCNASARSATSSRLLDPGRHSRLSHSKYPELRLRYRRLQRRSKT